MTFKPSTLLSNASSSVKLWFSKNLAFIDSIGLIIFFWKNDLKSGTFVFIKTGELVIIMESQGKDI